MNGVAHDPNKHNGKAEGMKLYRFYLFDADGTLMDTAELIYRSYKYTLQKHNGPDLSRKEIQAGIGIPLRTNIEKYLGPMYDEKYAQIYKEHNGYQFSIAPDYLSLFPGVEETLSSLRDQAEGLAVVSSRTAPTLLPFFRTLGIAGYFDHFVTPELTEEHKPHPQPVFKALELLGGTPGEALMVGDTDWDIRSGNSAGVDTCLVWRDDKPAPPEIRPTFIVNRLTDIM